ncbi:ATP-binding protein [Rhizobium leguminosarum]|uniref:ATP-binding protein n=1 Tax=Rhizobium leguminosarum TaxID=384 RepID=UPI00102F4978|nr:ATP-binding protein [Rhizobium leguminosarum]TAY98681.1 ATP-binding protein [Rhizobium leguminosarum]TAZ09446.1 ATP-binding protein [Rhizobium leguminosarum]
MDTMNTGLDANGGNKPDVYDYIENPGDKMLAEMLQELVNNVELCRRGVGSQRRALFLIGGSGSGKSTALAHHFRRMPEFQPRVNEYSETVRPLLSIEAPKPCTTKDFAVAILDALGVPSKARQSEGQLFATVKTQFRERGIIFLHVDEAQHLRRHSTQQAINDVQDRIKTLMQIADWPLHMIFSGVQDLADLLKGGHGQVARRSLVTRFIPLTVLNNKDHIQGVLSEIVEKRCGLLLPEELQTDDFIGRLCLANSGSFGEIIKAIQAACFLVMRKGKDTVDVRAFAHNYQRSSGCMPSDNIFTAARWSEIDPANALADLATPETKGRK